MADEVRLAFRLHRARLARIGKLGRNAKARLAVLALTLLTVLVLLADSRLTEPFKIESVVFRTDAQGHAWPDSRVVITFNKPLRKEWLERSLRASPPVEFGLEQEEEGRWLRKTRLTVNPAQAPVFATDCVYRIILTRPSLTFAFETITTPRVVGTQPNDRAAETTAPFVVFFDRPMGEQATIRATSTPEVPLELFWYSDRALVLLHPRLANDTDYELVLAAGIEDVEGHPMQDEFRFRFRTIASPTVVEFAPQGEEVGLQDGVRVAFSTDVDRGSVEAAFRIEPPTEGSFHWPDSRTLIWRPQGLEPGQSYRILVGGLAMGGDPIVPADWRFRTVVPPVRITPGGGGKLVLTFDDDPPSLAHGYALLDVLARYGVRAIFFPTGAWAAAHPDFVRRARAEGHLVCNHTYSHPDLTSLSEEAVRFQILNGAGAGQCDLLRPPYARSNGFVEAIASSLGYRIYLWNVDSRDWEARNVRDLVNLVLGDVRPGAVVLFHAHALHTLEALPLIIERLHGAGYVLWY